MQTFMKRAAVLALCLIMLLQLAACDASKLLDDATVDQLVSVWSAPSTVKISKTATTDDLADKTVGLTFNTVKNEYESHQLLLTADQGRDISAYYLEVSNLESEAGDVLSKDNFTVYMEKYVSTTDSAYDKYSHPDALIPQDAALEHGELTIATDENGALWVTVYVPAETPAGTYTGDFQLAVENAVTTIPVTVTVNDYTLPKTTSGETLFSWRYNRVGAGELDSSIEMMETYYEFFLDYRISLQSLPMESLTQEEVIDTLTKYYDTLSTYTIVPEPGTVPGGGTIAEKSKEMIYAIASISSPEKNYFDKAMLYVVDEPDLTDETKFQSTMDMITHTNNFLQACVDVIEADTTGTYDSFKSIEGWENSILNIPNVMPLTTHAGGWLFSAYEDGNTNAKAYLAAINTICPCFDVLTTENITILNEILDAYPNIKNVWWYGCSSPAADWGNYHIGDAALIRARTYSWVQAMYGIEGNLYWDAAAYTDENPLYADQYINVYEYPFRRSDATWPAGDGFLTYPGAAYGVYGPLPSMRLMSIRDGMEELEMLLALKNGEGEIETYVNAVSHNGGELYADGENGLSLDEQRASLITALLANQNGATFAVRKTVVEGSTANVSYYADESSKVYINGELQEPVSGGEYEYEMDLLESSTLNVELEAADGTTYQLSQFIAFPTTILQSFDDASVLEGITVSEGGAAELVQTEDCVTSGSSAHIQVTGKVTGDELADAVYVPTVSIDTAVLSGITDLTEVQIMNLDVYNPGEQFKIRVKIYSGSSFAPIGEYTVSAGKTTLSMSINKVAFSAMQDADRIVFEFDNTDDGVTANTYEFYLDNMTATK